MITYTIENLYHCLCSECGKWFSISGSLNFTNPLPIFLTCPHCDIKQEFKMKLQPGTEAHKAFQKGIEYAKQGRQIKDCPYTTNKVIALKNWFEKGYNETIVENNK